MTTENTTTSTQEQEQPVTIKARWASRRRGWGDNYSVQVWLPSGATGSCGAPTPADALAGAAAWAERMMGGPVRLEVMNRQPAWPEKGGAR